MALGPFMIGISGYELTAEEKMILAHPLIGGVILFSRNYQNSEQLRALTASIHAIKNPSLLIAVDQEGGRVQRFKSDFTLLPPPALCGKKYDQDPLKGLAMARLYGELMALELLNCGVDMSFAPVLDIDNGSQVIGDRAFHQDPTAVMKLSDAYCLGMRAAGMAACGKHFPGHGSVAIDTHLNTAIDPRDWEAIASLDLLPFIHAIHSGIESFMVAHVIYSSIDSVPAGFSKTWLQSILKQKLGFHGVIFSDDMGMMAAKHFGDPVTGIRAALTAGCDIILLCNEPEVVKFALSQFAEESISMVEKIETLRPKTHHIDEHRLESLHQQLSF